MLNVIDQLLLSKIRSNNPVIVIDNRFNSLELNERATVEWEVGIVGTVRKGSKNLPEIVKDSKQNSEFESFIKNKPRGYSETYVNGTTRLTVWNDKKPVYMLDNCVSVTASCTTLRREGSKHVSFFTPAVANVYNSNKCFVDTSDQLRSTNSIDFRTRRKQSRVFWVHFELYALIDARLLYMASSHLVRRIRKYKLSDKVLRGELVRTWIQRWLKTDLYAKYNQNSRGRKVSSFALFPQSTFGHIPVQGYNRNNRKECVVCKYKTTWFCAGCRIPGHYVTLCNPNTTNRDCWLKWVHHQHLKNE